MLNNFKWTAARLSITTMLALGSMLSVGSFAQDNEFVEEVVSIGTRGKPRSVSSSPVPVDVLSAEDISKTGTDDLLMQLQGSIPSLNVHLQPISDAASMIRPANLRGLSADATLIFTNGKRRHHASVIAFQGGGVNDGSQGADISVIPAIALKRVEVLRDGASAQYGSDAIAGVVNIILKDDFEGMSLEVMEGGYDAGDGDTKLASLTFGASFADGRGSSIFNIRTDEQGSVFARDRAPNTGTDQFYYGWYYGADYGAPYDSLILDPGYSSYPPQGRFFVSGTNSDLSLIHI